MVVWTWCYDGVDVVLGWCGRDADDVQAVTVSILVSRLTTRAQTTNIESSRA